MIGVINEDVNISVFTLNAYYSYVAKARRSKRQSKSTDYLCAFEPRDGQIEKETKRDERKGKKRGGK